MRGGNSVQFILLGMALFSSVYTGYLAYSEWSQKNRLGAVILSFLALSFPILAWMGINISW